MGLHLPYKKEEIKSYTIYFQYNQKLGKIKNNLNKKYIVEHI